MCTICLLTISFSILRGIGGVCLWMSAQGVSAKGGCLPGGVCQGVCISQHAMGQTPPMNRTTDRCKNITLPQTLFAGSKNYRTDIVSFSLGVARHEILDKIGKIVHLISSQNSQHLLNDTTMGKISLKTPQSHILFSTKCHEICLMTP